MMQYSQSEFAANGFPTSPWTEAFQAASQHQQDTTDAMAQPSFDNDDQRPTHDALSSIYNSGYEMHSPESAFLLPKQARGT